ncbi:MAG: dTDP-4-dehydrorhamnose 3,5-epimerase [Treponema sp.]|nr:dTDP-4-dehydrorhamnose 3,5-epimerase [Treponema sp.]
MQFTLNRCIAKNNKEISGLVEIVPKIFFDERGYTFETYSEKDFFANGLTMKFVQDNQSLSTKGTLRGLHFQKVHPQGKLIRVISGKIYDVVVDLRYGSETYGCYYGLILDSEKQNMFYVPEGFAHGFLTLSDTSLCSYKFTDFYHPEDEGGLMWNDPAIGIDWESILPGITQNANLSEKDKKHAPFSLDKKYFDLNAKWIGE